MYVCLYVRACLHVLAVHCDNGGSSNNSSYGRSLHNTFVFCAACVCVCVCVMYTRAHALSNGSELKNIDKSLNFLFRSITWSLPLSSHAGFVIPMRCCLSNKLKKPLSMQTNTWLLLLCPIFFLIFFFFFEHLIFGGFSNLLNLFIEK